MKWAVQIGLVLCLLFGPSAQAARHGRQGKSPVSARQTGKRRPINLIGAFTQKGTPARVARKALGLRALRRLAIRVPGIKVKNEGKPVRIKLGKKSKRVKVVWLHGAGETVDNELLHRMAGALGDEKVSVDLVAMPYMGSNYRQVQKYIADSDQRVVIAGHSLGSAIAHDLAEQFPDKVDAALLINPPLELKRSPAVPTLLVRGTDDGVGSDDRAMERLEVLEVDADHGLRHWRKGRPHNATAQQKQKAAGSKRTRKVNREVARRIKRFLADTAVR